jgi:putative flippase GtrA
MTEPARHILPNGCAGAATVLRSRKVFEARDPTDYYSLGRAQLSVPKYSNHFDTIWVGCVAQMESSTMTERIPETSTASFSTTTATKVTPSGISRLQHSTSLAERNDQRHDDDATSYSSASDRSEASAVLYSDDIDFGTTEEDSKSSLPPFHFTPIDISHNASSAGTMLRSRANSSSSVVVVGGGGSRSRTTSYTDVEMQQQQNSAALASGSFRGNGQRRSLIHSTGLQSPSFHRATVSVKNNSSPRSVTARTTLPPTALAKRTMDWVQSRRVPVYLVRKYFKRNSFARRSASTAPNDHAATAALAEEDDVVYWISGLDRVFLSHPSAISSSSSSGTNGTKGNGSCADHVRIAGLQPPRYLWYMVSGALCDVVQLTLLATLYRLAIGIPDRAALCWCLAFVLSIPVRHTCHRYLVFGDYVGGYRQSLLRMYAGYSVTIVLSTLFNFVMARMFVHSTLLHLSILTMLWTGVANYFILKYFWKVSGSTTTAATSSSANSVSA